MRKMLIALTIGVIAIPSAGIVACSSVEVEMAGASVHGTKDGPFCAADDSIDRDTVNVDSEAGFVKALKAHKHQIDTMKANDVTFAHMLSSDHVNFFDADSFRQLLLRYSSDVSIERSDPIYPFWFVGRSLPFYAMRLLFKAGMLRPRFFSRLYAVARVRKS